MNMRKLHVRIAIAIVFAGALFTPGAQARSGKPAAAAFPVKLMIVTMVGRERAPWIDNLELSTRIEVPGLPEDFAAVSCTRDGICLVTTGPGHANAAASMMALLFSKDFDFRRSYFLIAGIAGINPQRGTIGSAAWARYVVDAGIINEIDAREMPQDWPTGHFGRNTLRPYQKPPSLNYGTELFRLDEALLQKVLALTAGTRLDDDDVARELRKKYPAPANLPPAVIQCDVASTDTYWFGSRLAEYVEGWTETLTDRAGNYCTTASEDTATLTALTRAHRAGLVEFRRIAVLRAGSDFDRPYPGQSVLDLAESNYRAVRSATGGFSLAVNNLYRTAAPWITDVMRRWPEWQEGVPAP
jgi:purine nucleoside permease